LPLPLACHATFCARPFVAALVHIVCVCVYNCLRCNSPASPRHLSNNPPTTLMFADHLSVRGVRCPLTLNPALLTFFDALTQRVFIWSNSKRMNLVNWIIDVSLLTNPKKYITWNCCRSLFGL